MSFTCIDCDKQIPEGTEALFVRDRCMCLDSNSTVCRHSLCPECLSDHRNPRCLWCGGRSARQGIHQFCSDVCSEAFWQQQAGMPVTLNS